MANQAKTYISSPAAKKVAFECSAADIRTLLEIGGQLCFQKNEEDVLANIAVSFACANAPHFRSWLSAKLKYMADEGLTFPQLAEADTNSAFKML
jgi:hypothetical protein